MKKRIVLMLTGTIGIALFVKVELPYSLIGAFLFGIWMGFISASSIDE